jgi:hypothetical protein
MAPNDVPRYRFGPLERRGVIGGLRKSQALLVGVGLVVGVVALRVAPNGPNVLLAGAASALAALVAFLPIRGRSIEEWSPVVARYLWRRARGRDRLSLSTPAVQVIASTHSPTRLRSRPEPGPQLTGCCDVLSRCRKRYVFALFVVTGQGEASFIGVGVCGRRRWG